MKQLVLFSILIIFTQIAFANNITKSYLSTGKNIQPDCILIDNDTCIFESEKKLTWEFCACLKGNDKEYLIKSASDTTKFVLPVTIEEIQDIIYAEQFTSTDGMHVYYCGYVIAYDTATEETDTFSLKFDLLPTIPQLISASWVDLSLGEYDEITTDSKFYIEFAGHNVDYVATLESYSMYFKDENKTPRWTTRVYIYDLIKENNIIKFKCEYLDWGTYVRFQAKNKWSGAWCEDTLFTTDYIHDPEMLARFDTWRNSSTVEEVNSANIEIKYNQETIDIVDLQNEITNISLYNSIGQPILSNDNSKSINISNLKSGIYILVYRTKNDKIVSRKIFKQ